MDKLRIRDHLLILAGYTVQQCFFRTYRIVLEGFEHLLQSPPPHLFAIWHGHQFPLLPLMKERHIGIMVSRSRDGEMQARAIQKMGYHPLRGSSSRGAVAGLVGLIHYMQKGFPAAVAVDGPRGPRYEPKDGVLKAAYLAHATILPMAVEASSAWRLKSWDRYLIPKPFSWITARIGKPLPLSKNMETDRERLKKALFSLAPEG